MARYLQRVHLSPDGRLLAGLARHPQTGRLALRVVDAVDGSPRHELQNPQLTNSYAGVGWTPDGKALLFTTAERTNLWKQLLTSPAPVQVTDFSDLWVTQFEVSPDGGSLLLSRGAAMRDAFLLTNFR